MPSGIHGYQIVSIQKWPFPAISASSRGVACAAYHSTPLRNPLFSLTLQKITYFWPACFLECPPFLSGWKEAIKDSELPYREAKASIGNLR